MSEEKNTFELKDEELKKVNGGENEYPDSAGFQYDGYNVVDSCWGCPCKKEGHEPYWMFGSGSLCNHCNDFRQLSEPINGWDGYCIWKKIK